MRNDERNDRNGERLAQRCEARLRQVNADLATLRRQPLDADVLEQVVRTERETERWSRISAALGRPHARVLLLEEPSLVLARVLSGLREDWRGTGLQVVSSCRPLGPRRLDRRACLEALRVLADLLLASFETPRRLEGCTRLDGDAFLFELSAQGDDLAFRREDSWPSQVLIEQAGGTLSLQRERDSLVACVALDPENDTPSRAREVDYVFPLSPSEPRVDR